MDYQKSEKSWVGTCLFTLAVDWTEGSVNVSLQLIVGKEGGGGYAD